MRKTKLLSMILSLLMLLISVCVPIGAAETEEAQTGKLNGYLLGYMSWGIERMGLDVLQEKLENSGRALPEVRVAVLDTGLKKSNRYLQGRYLDEGYNFIDNNTDYDDDQYHGTEVSGVIADGTSSNVKILPIKVMDSNGDGKMSDTAKGIYYALDHGADVINLSLSGDDKNHTYHSLDDAIAEAVSRNVVVVVAAGNQDGDASLRYPANKDNVITITSINKRNNLGLLANYGSVIDFALPGMNILAPHRGTMLLDSGTSLAAPHAAAAAALLKTWDKSLNQAEIYEIFKQYSVDLGDKGFDDTFGWGMIDLSGFDINSAYVRPTEQPTEAPTQAPTEAPTEEPTQAPTQAPTHAPTEVPTQAPEPLYILGDADGDVSSIDVTLMQRKLAEMSVYGAFDELAADADRDGELTALDVTLIRRYLVGVDTGFAIGEPVFAQ